MKKNLLLFAALILMGATTFGQAVKDRNVIPVAVNLNQVLRMTILNGGNIEFVFNTIDQYKNGITGAAGAAAPMYQTDFTVASSTRWNLTYGAEDGTFIGTDDPTNTLDLDNVGFGITSTGLLPMELAGLGTTLGAANYSAQVPAAADVAALVAYPVLLLQDNGDPVANAGDAADNAFTIVWRCGTTEVGSVVSMNADALITQDPSPAPDRYVTNVLFDLGIE